MENNRRLQQRERKRVQKIRKRANQTFVDYNGLDRHDPLFIVKYEAAILSRAEQRKTEMKFI